MAVRKRKVEADYINVGTAEAPEYALCGTGFSSLTESPSAQTSSKRYINMDSSRQSVTGYEWSASFETDQIKEESAIDYILNIGRKLLTGADVETDFIQVDLDSPVAEKEDTYTARKRTVAIAVSEFADNDGEMGCNGDLLGVSDPTEGEFNIKTKTFVNPNQPLGALTVSSAEGTTSGTTKLTVSPALSSGNMYRYKIGDDIALPAYDAACTTGDGWQDWDGAADITAATGNKITVVELTTQGAKARKGGSCPVVAKAANP